MIRSWPLRTKRIRVRNLEKLEEEELNRIAVLRDTKRVGQDVKRLESERKMLLRTMEDVLHGTVREGSCLMGLLDLLVKKLERYYAGIEMTVVQQFQSL